MKLLLIILIFLLTACSTSQPKNKWQYEASAAQDDYQKHFLQNRLSRASSDLSQARKSALQSANFHTIIDIELSVCALNITVLTNDTCQKAEALLKLEPNIKQSAYLHLLQNNYSKKEIRLLPPAYQNFAMAKLKNKEINTILSNVQPLSSRAVASALVKDEISQENIQDLIKEFSFHGYKNPIIAWLRLQMKQANSTKEKAYFEQN